MKKEVANCDLKLGWVFPRMWEKENEPDVFYSKKGILPLTWEKVIRPFA